MRILHVIASVDPRTGGPVQGIKSILSAARDQGHEVEVLSLDCPSKPFVEEFPGVLHAIGPSHLGRFFFNSRLQSWLKTNVDRFDAVVINGLWQFHGYGAWRVLRKSSVPYFVFTHGMLDPWFRRKYPLKHLKKWLYWPWGQYPVLRDAAAVLFTCEEEKRLARQSFWLYRCKEVVVPYGTPDVPVDSKRAATAFLSRFPMLSGKRCLLFLGRIERKKGCDLLIEAFARIVHVDDRLHLVMAGPDQIGWQSELECAAVELGISERITWTGMLGAEDKWGALEVAEVFSLPSHTENFGIAVAEALAAGTPVIISNRVNIWSEIKEDCAGLVHDDTLDGTTEALRAWLQMCDKERLEVVGNARACFERRFHIQRAVRTLYEVLGCEVRATSGDTVMEAA